MNWITNSILFSIPERHKQNTVSHQKAIYFVGLNFLVFTLGLIAGSYTHFFAVEDPMHIFTAAILALIIGFIFTKTGSFYICGNLQALNIYMATIVFVPQVGAIFADGVWWILAPPFIALFFSGFRSGFAWFFVAIISSIVLFYVTNLNLEFHINRILLDPEVYLISQVCFFIFLFGIGCLFYFSKEKSFEVLENTLITVEEQKIKLRKQSDEILDSYHALEEANRNLEHKIDYRAKQLLEAENLYQTIIQYLDVVIIETNIQNKILQVKNHHNSFFSEVKTGIPFNQYFEDESAFIELKSNIVKYGKGKLETKLVENEKSDCWGMISGVSYTNGNVGVKKFIYLILDLSERKEMEENLLEANRKAIKAQQSERSFLATMSHEIRTPLNAIIGMTTLLKEQNKQPNQVEYFDLLENSSNILLGLLTDILDFAKISSGNFESETSTFNLVNVVKEATLGFQGQCKVKNVDLTVNYDKKFEGITVSGNLTVFNQILMNLVSNSVKFTEKGSIDINITQDVFNEKKAFIITVKDTGIGIKPSDINSVFLPYEQVKHNIAGVTGTGLGLPIIKQLIEMLEGFISVESKFGEGSVFTFSIPLMQSQRAPEIVEKTKEKPLSDSKLLDNVSLEGLSVLVVEDNIMNQKYISSVLRKMKVKFDIASDGSEGVEQAKKKKYDLIFMDVQMPGISGIEAANIIKSTENLNKGTPIVALTASVLKEIQQDSYSTGMVDFITKPYKPSQLKEVLVKFAI